MTCLYLLDSSREPLRHVLVENCAARSDAAEFLLLDLADHPQPAHPHLNDLWGWHRFFRRRHVTAVEAFQPDNRCWAILTAGRLQRARLRLHLDEPFDHVSPLLARLLLGWAGDITVTHGGLAAGLSCVPRSARVRVSPPPCGGDLACGQSEAGLRDRLAPHGGRLVLAIAPPSNPLALLGQVWAAAIVRHIYPDFTLLVAGPVGPAARRRIAHWQATLDAPNLVAFDSVSPFASLARAADVVLGSSRGFRESLRLACAAHSGTTIIAAGAICRELLAGRPQVHLVAADKPRHLARALLQMLESPALSC